MKHRAGDIEESNAAKSVGSYDDSRAEFPEQSRDFKETFRDFTTDFGSY